MAAVSSEPIGLTPFSFLTTLYHNMFCLSYSIIKILQNYPFYYCMKKARRGESRFFPNSLGFVLGYTIHPETNEIRGKEGSILFPIILQSSCKTVVSIPYGEEKTRNNNLKLYKIFKNNSKTE